MSCRTGLKAWTPREDEWLRDLYPGTSNRVIAKMLDRKYLAIKNRALKLGLKKSPEHMASRPGCFRKGEPTWNKGLSYQPGGRIQQSQFKAGRKPHNTVAVGTEVIDSYGYRKRKVRDDAPTGKGCQNWKFLHVIAWEEHNGPLPKGHIVRFRDGDQSNLEPSNLVAISRAENGVLNKLYQTSELPAEWFDVMLDLARIKIIEKKRKREMAA